MRAAIATAATEGLEEDADGAISTGDDLTRRGGVNKKVAIKLECHLIVFSHGDGLFFGFAVPG